MRLLAPVVDWIEERTGLRSLLGRICSGEADPRGAWLRTTGFCCLVLIGVLAMTGLFLALFYSPAPQQAYASVKAIDSDPFGRFIRSLHYAASAALITVAALGVLRMLVCREFLGGRDIVWLCALGTMLLALGGQLTGHLLPWDANAVATAEIEAGLAGNTWVVGPAIKKLILGGATTGAGTLSRWYTAHLLLIPAGFVVVGLALLMHRLSTQRKEMGEEIGETRQAYYPFHVAREMVVALAVVAALAFWALGSGAPLGPEATSQNLMGYKAQSEWYVAPLHGLILVPPFNRAVFEPLATAVLPGFAVAALAALPFLARRKGSALQDRRVLQALAGAGVLGMAALAVYGGIVDRTSSHPELAAAAERPPIDGKLVAAGVKLYDKLGCAGCHKINGVGGTICPDLSDEGRIRPDRQWQIDHLVSPSSKVPGSTMPAYPDLKSHELAALAEYMVSLVKPAPAQSARNE